MAASGVQRIDDLLDGRTPPIGQGDSDADAIGVVQDLLVGQGFKLPGILGRGHGSFGEKTAAAVQAFQSRNGLPPSAQVDAATLSALVTVPATSPLACRGYLTLVLDLLFSGLTRLMSYTCLFEGAGRFDALNRNTDHQGVSFGLIQWAQKPGRLTELLRAFRAAEPELFAEIFGDGDAAVSDGVIAHTATAHGGVDPKTGATVNPKFDLLEAVWVERFKAAARRREFQSVQVALAVKAFRASLARLQEYAPQVVSERGVAFMLDVANQHGDGGAHAIFTAVAAPALSESELLARVATESVARVTAQYGVGPEAESTASRRVAFRTTALLSDGPFASA